ncbi:TonB family protein [Rugamonas sp. CCM 8940]|uniref:TonB family protein n=1 Tax=Rugamonas sp. CCM 8940 TaxID=2765359 RepID=UPI0018F491DA|nr:TonB family protein [Rugamonas sp. CCM 8940]MBJ7312938.1 TonB family protein [Rugamonas sp. CCM 8940]
MTKLHSHYDSLNVTRDAPAEVIRAAYRSLSQKHHPDKNSGDQDAAQMMARLNTAYSVLSDPDQRELYDLQIIHGWHAREGRHDAQEGREGGNAGAPPRQAPRPADGQAANQADVWFRLFGDHKQGRNLRVVGALIGSLSLVLSVVIYVAWQENQSALRIETTVLAAAKPDQGSPAAAGTTAEVATSNGSAGKPVAVEPSTPSSAPKVPAAPAPSGKASEYERLTAMLKSMGFGLHKLDAPAPAQPPTPHSPASRSSPQAADAGRESAVPAPAAPTAKVPAPAESARLREESDKPAVAEAARGESKPVATANPSGAAVAGANPASAGQASRTAMLADARACAAPPYPTNSYRNGESGTVQLALLVGGDGRVIESKVQKSSGFPELDKAARKALSLCKFKPASGDALAEPTWTNIIYAWSID